MKMAEKIRARIDELCTLFAFEYGGKEGHIDPYSHTEYLLWFDGDEMTVHTIDAVMDTPFFDGRTLAQIADEITVTEW